MFILMGSFIVSCSQKLPVPGPEGTGMLMIPTTTVNYTQYNYGYYYTLIYNPQTQAEIKIVPLGSRKFVTIDGLPPGDYRITGITSLSSSTAGLADVSSETQEFSKSIPFQIRSNEITLLEYMFSVEQHFQDTNISSRYYQGYDLRPLDESQYGQVVSELKSLENAELWNLANLPDKPTIDKESGVFSSNQLYLTWYSWRRH